MNVSAVLETPTMPNFTNCTNTDRQAAPLNGRPAHRRERVADVVAEGPAAVEQKAVGGADDEADGRGREVPDAEDLQQDGVDDERERRVGDADDAELHELHKHGRGQSAARSRYA